MTKLIWKISAFFWFWRLAGFISWEAAGVLYDSYSNFPLERDEPKLAVCEELAEWDD